MYLAELGNSILTLFTQGLGQGGIKFFASCEDILSVLNFPLKLHDLQQIPNQFVTHYCVSSKYFPPASFVLL